MRVSDVRRVTRDVAQQIIEVEPNPIPPTLVGPPSLLPGSNPWGVRMSSRLDEELGDVDVVYLLRIQRERGAVSG